MTSATPTTQGGAAPAHARRGAAPPGALELLGLGGILLVYIGLLEILPVEPAETARWWRLTAPNGWLLAAVLAWAALGKDSRWIRSAGRPSLVLPLGAMALAAVMVALLVATPPELIRRSAHPGQEPTFAMLLLVLVVPIAEELYFRGLLLARLRELLGDLGAAVAVSLLFGFLHLAQSSHLEMAALSLGLCFLTIWAGTVAWAVLGHVAWNGAAVLLGSQAGEGRTWPALAAAAALAVGGLWLFWRARAAGPVEPGSSEASAGEKLAPVLGLGPGQGRRRDKTPGAHDRSKRKG